MIPSEDYLEQGLLYEKKSGGGLWRIIAYCQDPTVTMENIDTHERECFGIGGLTAQEFTPRSKRKND